ncbi:MAG: IPExxxVDY family protein [Capnocytophaga sp.]|nr:IPExxxVDY family protein [Capnocytophaga sp.]
MKFVLEFDEDFEERELFIAIHSPAEPHRLAYWFNRMSQVRFVRALEDFYDKESEQYFPFFHWENDAEQWFLIANKRIEISQGEGLFYEIEKRFFLLKEFPKVDYFLRISNYSEKENYLSLLKKIQWIDYFFEIEENLSEKESTKTKNNIIKLKTKLTFEYVKDEKNQNCSNTWASYR